MDEKQIVKMSKFLSLVLRHRPQRIGLTLDEHGWADVDALIAKANEAGVALDRDLLQRVVANNNKQRFAFSGDAARIRANQGHSIDVDLGLTPLTPPPLLYHGTAVHALPSIQAHGLQRRGRQHVHLSPDAATAVAVGRRHGQPVVLQIQAEAMAAAGHRFYRSANGVWLTEHVPVPYLIFPNEQTDHNPGSRAAG